MHLPSTSPVTLPFGSTASPYSADSPHKGTDFAYLPDNKIYAPFSGKITLIPNNGPDGNGIYMYNGNQFHGLLHCSQYLVTSGTSVKEGQAIGIMGATGFAQGTHLHWCVQVDGTFIDPLTLLPNKKDTMTTQQVDEMISATYQAIAGRPPTDAEFTFHREQYAKQGDAWWLQMVEGFKGDDIAWKKYERNLVDAGKLITENPDAKALAEIKNILERK